jgi:hypothetical protein
LLDGEDHAEDPCRHADDREHEPEREPDTLAPNHRGRAKVGRRDHKQRHRIEPQNLVGL